MAAYLRHIRSRILVTLHEFTPHISPSRSGWAACWLAPIFVAGSRPLAGWLVSCGEALQVAAVQALCAERRLVMA